MNTETKRRTVSCRCGKRIYTVTDIDLGRSQYLGLYPSEMSVRFLPYYSTVDDYAIRDIGWQLKDKLKGKGDRKKAAVALSMVMQNTEYATDESRFGKDLWELPVLSLGDGKADCDGRTGLFVALAYNMGLDVITVISGNHMFPAVNLDDGNGRYYEFENRRYYPLETAEHSVKDQKYSDPGDFIHMARPEMPTEKFKRTLSNSRPNTVRL